MKITNLITADILQGIDDINKKCHAMHIPSPPVQFISAEVRDADGTLSEVYKSKSNTWVRNAYNYLSSVFLPCDTIQGTDTFGAGSMSLKSTAGTTRRKDAFVPYLTSGLIKYIFNEAANANFGIVIGTGDTAESFEHTSLSAIVAHGTGAGQMSYAIGTNTAATYDSGTKKWTSAFSRTFVNSSGSDITVKEIGVVYSLNYQTGVSDNFLITRDVLASPVTVANGQTLTITYTSEITYPA